MRKKGEYYHSLPEGMMEFASPCCSVHMSSTCQTLLKELEQIWKDIGETEADKNRMLSELERDCLEVYRRKVEEASNRKSCLHQSVATKEAEVATLMAALGELNINSLIKPEKKSASLKEQLALVTPLIDDLRVKKDERVKQFADVKAQIDKISSEISEYFNIINAMSSLNQENHDLSLRNLSEYQSHLRALQKEKAERIQKVLDCVNEVHSLCGVLGLDFGKTVSDVHPSLHKTSLGQSTNISASALESLEQAIIRLKTERKVRYQKLKDVAGLLVELWTLMDTTREEKSKLSRITSVLCLSEAEVTEPGALSLEVIQQVSTEVERLTKLKASRMKELVIKRRIELEDICYRNHIEPDPSTSADKSSAMIDSGLVDPCELLANIEAQISKAEDEALSRKDIMDRIDWWLSACEEENWLEDYNQDYKRYSGGRGAHINLKRAEQARIKVTKIPVVVNTLINKTLAWEDEKQKLFIYDGVRLVSILEDYKLVRQQKEEAKKRARDQKKLHDMLLAEKESVYGSKPSPRRSSSFRKANGYRTNGNGSVTPSPHRNSFSSATPELLTPRSNSVRHNGYFKEMRRLSTVPLNFVATAKEDTVSFSSISGPEPESPPQG
ncbi:65-kDa microtubule-associated protein 6-like [Lycium barbarum]|uniref:65-kDa microtubule-associated protein 6-like n=1 Tax=Lycium barbarum TaxID=112863 RepID=UPI00293F4BD8|nr:65-kDa microtubule-associated protein 6-like [Lycium barbarum]